MNNDLLVKLYALPDASETYAQVRTHGVEIRRAIAPEKHVVTAWVGEHFGAFWVSETDVSFSRQPISCWIATLDRQCVGFACYDTTARGFFGPTGVVEAQRGKGIGKALLFVCLYDMRAQGYGYAIIGSAGPVDFYAAAVGATVIPDSSPGVYQGMLRGKPSPSES